MLFAVFVSALLLSIGLSIYSIARKELLLSSAGRESQFAFAAADAGVECTLYWDFQHHAFTPQEPDEVYSTDIACGTIVDAPNACLNGFSGGSTRTITTPTGFGVPDGQSSFSVRFSNGSCADIIVTKHSSTTLPTCTKSRCTIIISQGFNTEVTNDPFRLQRTLRFTY